MDSFLPESVRWEFRDDFRSDEVHSEVIEWLSAVRIPDPERVSERYSFELSGGMIQRVMIRNGTFAEPFTFAG